MVSIQPTSFVVHVQSMEPSYDLVLVWHQLEEGSPPETAPIPSPEMLPVPLSNSRILCLPGILRSSPTAIKTDGRRSGTLHNAYSLLFIS